MPYFGFLLMIIKYFKWAFSKLLPSSFFGVILVLIWIHLNNFRWNPLNCMWMSLCAQSHKHLKIIVSVTWLSRCDLYIWPFLCPLLSFTPWHSIYSLDFELSTQNPTQQMTQSVRLENAQFLNFILVRCACVRVLENKLWYFVPWKRIHSVSLCV